MFPISRGQQEKFDFDKDPEELKIAKDDEESKTTSEKTKSKVDLEMYVKTSKHYYFTDLDLVIFMEPCIMCAMALSNFVS